MKLVVLLSWMLLALLAPSRGEDEIQLSFKNADIEEVLSLYRKLTGFHVIASNQVVGTLSVSTPGPVKNSKAIQLLENALFENGFPIVQNKPDIVHVLGVGGNPNGAELPTITDPREIPEELRVVRYVYKLKFRSPEKVADVLQRHLWPTMMGVPLITIDPEIRAVLITERSSVLPSLLKLIDELDVPPVK